MSNRVNFAGLELELLPGWYDITDDLDAGAPSTLARGGDGVGAIQFTVGRYRGGPVPDFGVRELAAMLEEFGRSNSLRSMGRRQEREGKLRYVSEDFVDVQDFVRLYYISDGPNIGMITYRCELGDRESGEVEQADSLVASVSFL